MSVSSSYDAAPTITLRPSWSRMRWTLLAALGFGLLTGGIALLVTLPLARRGIVAGVAMAFGRALGDFGATMIVSGSVPMATTMSIALYNAVAYGPHHQAMVLALVQLGVALAILFGVSRLGKVRPW